MSVREASGDKRNQGQFTGQIACLSPATPDIHIADISTFFPTNGPSSPSARENRMKPSAICVHVSLCLSVWPDRDVYLYKCIIHMHLCTCLLGIHPQPRPWLELGTRSCGSLIAMGLPDSATPTNPYRHFNIRCFTNTEDFWINFDLTVPYVQKCNSSDLCFVHSC